MSVRTPLPETHRSRIRKVHACGFDLYTIVGFYENGRPGAVFVTIAKAGSTVAGLVRSWCMATSMALQHGADWDSMKGSFLGQAFSPSDDRMPSLIHAIAAAVTELVEGASHGKGCKAGQCCAGPG